MMTPRLEKLKKALNDAKPSISVERARLVTEAYKKYANCTPLIQRASVFAYVLDNMTVYIQDNELIVGNHSTKSRATPVFPEYGAKWILDEMPYFETRNTDPLVIDPEDKAELIQILESWGEETFDIRVTKLLDPQAIQAQECGIISIGGRNCGTGHTVADYEHILPMGLRGMINEAQEKLDTYKITCDADIDKIDFWKSVIISTEAVIRFGKRYSTLATEMAAKETDPVRKKELEKIADVCSNVPENQPRDFWEAVQFVWFCQLCYQIEDNGHGVSFGRYDQYLYPYYRDDVESGGPTSKELADELLYCCWIKATELTQIRDRFDSTGFAGYPMWQNIVYSGLKRDGTDGTNGLSFAMVRSWDTVRTTQPSLSLRYHDGTPEDILRESMKLTQDGCASPAFFNDKLIVGLVKSKGATLEDARDYSFHGCTECNVTGCTDGRPQVGYVNVTKCLELALNNGYDPMAKVQIGPKTGELSSFKSTEDVFQATIAQMKYFIKVVTDAYTIVGAMHSRYLPKTFTSAVVGGCMEKGLPVEAGGAKYSCSGAFLVALANASDSLMAIEQLVYRDKSITLEKFVDILHEDYKNDERLRQMIINKVPKYGNDNHEVDAYAKRFVTEYNSEIHKYRDNRGAEYEFAVLSSSFNVLQGKTIGATPDGRHAGDPVADNGSPMAGRDTTSPTATIKSLASIDQTRPQNGTLFNIKFDPNVVKGEAGLDILENCVKSYFNMLGQHIQINVVSAETLREAQKHPQDYGNLMVRVAGYSAYFIELDKDVQENMINKTAHNNCGCGCGC